MQVEFITLREPGAGPASKEHSQWVSVDVRKSRPWNYLRGERAAQGIDTSFEALHQDYLEQDFQDDCGKGADADWSEGPRMLFLKAVKVCLSSSSSSSLFALN
jgi:hypothetical protein